MIGSFTLIMKTKIFVLFTTLLLSLQCFAKPGYIERLRNLQGNSAAAIEDILNEYAIELGSKCNQIPQGQHNAKLAAIFAEADILGDDYEEQCLAGYSETVNCKKMKTQIIDLFEKILSYSHQTACDTANKLWNDEL